MEPERARAIREQLTKILQSVRFRGSPKLSELLRYIIEHAVALPPHELKAHLKESVVAIEVFNEVLASGDDKKSTVRVQAYNLRNALAQYYANEALNDDIVIMIPTGEYIPVFRSWSSPEGADAPAPQASGGDLPTTLPSSSRYTLSIDVDEQHLPEVLARLHRTLLTAPGQPSLRVDYSGPVAVRPLYVRSGSVLLYVECTTEGYQWLFDAWQTGALQQALGYPVTALTLSRDVDHELYQNSRSSLERCATLPVAMTDAKLDEMHLVVVNPGSLDFWPVVHLVVLHSQDLKSWRTILSRNLTIPMDHGYFLYRLNFGRFGMPAVIMHPPKIGGRKIGLGYIRRNLPKNTGWETELQKFPNFYRPQPPFQGGWLSAEVSVAKYEGTSSLYDCRLALELTLGDPQVYVPPSVYEVRDGEKHYYGRPERRFVGIALRTEDLSTEKDRDALPPLNANDLLSEFDEFSQQPE